MVWLFLLFVIGVGMQVDYKSFDNVTAQKLVHGAVLHNIQHCNGFSSIIIITKGCRWRRRCRCRRRNKRRR